MEACTEILSSWKRLTDRAIAEGSDYQGAIRRSFRRPCGKVARFRKFNIDSKFSPVLELQHV
jgi:hypothetical protein